MSLRKENTFGSSNLLTASKPFRILAFMVLVYSAYKVWGFFYIFSRRTCPYGDAGFSPAKGQCDGSLHLLANLIDSGIN